MNTSDLSQISWNKRFKNFKSFSLCNSNLNNYSSQLLSDLKYKLRKLRAAWSFYLLFFCITAVLNFQKSCGYEYHLTEFTANSVANKDDSSGNPLLYKGYGGIGNAPIKTRQGMMIQKDQILSTVLNSPTGNFEIVFIPPTTSWFAVFIFDVNQMSTLFWKPNL